MKKLVAILISGVLVTSVITPIFAGQTETLKTTIEAPQASPTLTSVAPLPVSYEDLSTSISDKDITKDTEALDKIGNLKVTGTIPELNSKTKSTNDSINSQIESLISAKIQEAVKDNAITSDFSYKVFKGGNSIISIVIYNTEVNASGKDSALTINFDNNTGKILSLTDVLGIDAVAKTNSAIMSEIGKTPDSYDPTFKGIKADHNFYVNGNNVVIPFDAYEISAGAMGMPEFKVPMAAPTASNQLTSTTLIAPAPTNLIAPNPDAPTNIIAPNPAPPVAVSTIAKDKDVTSTSGTLDIKGVIPSIAMNDTAMNDSLNALITKAYTDEVAVAQKDKAKSLDFSYTIQGNSDIVSILISSTETSGSAKDSVSTINFNKNTGDVLKVNDILGANGLKIANKVIADEFKASPSKYDPAFRGISNDQNFYMNGSDMVLVFNQYEVAAGSEGLVKVTVNPAYVTNSVLQPKDYKARGDITMLPLRTLSENFGYSVNWDAATKSIDITRGDFKTSIKINDNTYESKSLESAPTLINGVTYVPISFFEKVLGLNYDFDHNGVLTLSQYK